MNAVSAPLRPERRLSYAGADCAGVPYHHDGDASHSWPRASRYGPGRCRQPLSAPPLGLATGLVLDPSLERIRCPQTAIDTEPPTRGPRRPQASLSAPIPAAPASPATNATGRWRLLCLRLAQTYDSLGRRFAQLEVRRSTRPNTARRAAGEAVDTPADDRDEAKPPASRARLRDLRLQRRRPGGAGSNAAPDAGLRAVHSPRPTTRSPTASHLQGAGDRRGRNVVVEPTSYGWKSDTSVPPAPPSPYPLVPRAPSVTAECRRWRRNPARFLVKARQSKFCR